MCKGLSYTIQCSMYWCQESHSLFPCNFRGGVRYVCMLNVALQQVDSLPKLPDVLWYLITMHLPRRSEFSGRVRIANDIRQLSQTSALFMAIAVADLWPPICDLLSSIFQVVNLYNNIYTIRALSSTSLLLAFTSYECTNHCLSAHGKVSCSALHAYLICSEVLFNDYQLQNNRTRNLTDFTYSFYDIEWRLSNVEHIIVLIIQSITLVYHDMMHSFPISCGSLRRSISAAAQACYVQIYM